MRHQRNESMTSHRFYHSKSIDHKLRSFMETSEPTEQKDLKTKQSRHLPFWAWYIIAKCNGIPMQKGQKPFLGSLLNVLTFLVALSFATSYTWFIVFEILSPSTPRDIADGTVSILMVFCWCAFGYYCKKLSTRLFRHRRFVKDVRMHSRTVFKINAVFLALFLGIAFSAANIYESTKILDLRDCKNIHLYSTICYILSISSMAFTVSTLIWHSLISFVFLSVCRTHTIGLRCFIREIEQDASKARNRHLSIYKGNDEEESQESFWTDDELDTVQNPLYQRNARANTFPKQHGAGSQAVSASRPVSGEISILLSRVSDNLEYSAIDSCEADNRELIGNEIIGPMENEMHVMAAADDSLSSTNGSHMTCTEILHNYWKLNTRLRFSSSAMQRWFASFLALVLLRCSTYLVHWLTHVATIFDILQFILPLTLLIVLSTALAEVNFEGQRFLRALYPTENRLKMLQFLSLNPLQMPIYGFGMTHGTIVTVVFAILVGFVTRIVITELTK